MHINMVHRAYQACCIPKENKTVSEDGESSQKLGLTAHWTAAIRANENNRADRLFTDPWASALAGREGRE